MIFKYDITVPLTYNRFAIQSNDPDSELCYEVEQCYEEELKVVFRTFEFSSYGDGYDFEDTVKVKLHKTGIGNEQDDAKLICEINGMLVDDDIYARKFSEKVVNRICKRLSLVFIKHNANRHLYQPQVQAMWSKAVFKRCEYAPFVEAKRKIHEEIDGKNKTIYLEDYIYTQDSAYCIVNTKIPSAEINIGEWLSEENEVVEFLMDEYYLALGTENIKSKFFHLFAIIEFCEKEYEDYNGSSRILSDDEVDTFIAGARGLIDAEDWDQVKSFLKGNLIKIYDIGRVRKLENILRWMGIEKYKYFGADKAVNKELLSSIIKLRNKSFHGTKEKSEDVEGKYANAVEELLYIDEKILDFVMKDSNQDKMDGIYLIYGKDKHH